MEDEIELMRSKEFVSRVVDSLKTNNIYIEHGKIRSSEIYDYAPFKIEVVKIADSAGSYAFNIQILSDKAFLLNKETKPRSFFSNIETDGSVFRIFPSGINSINDAGRRFTFKWIPVRSAAADISSGLTITQKSRLSNVLLFTLKTMHPAKGVDILNRLMKEYGTYNVTDKG